MAITPVHPSSKIKKTLHTKKKILRKRDSDGILTTKPRKVVSFDIEKPIASYEPKVETTRVNTTYDPEFSSPMDRALEVQANLASTFPSFVKNMLPSHVAGGFWLGLPKKFCDLHLPKNDKTVVLVDESDSEYETKYLVDKTGLSAGWRGFSIAHKLHEKDVLVFHLIQQCKFKVYILRANASTEVDGAISLLQLGAFTRNADSDHEEKDLKITEMAEKHIEQFSQNHIAQGKEMVALCNVAEADYSWMDTDNDGSEDSEGLRLSQSVVDFKDVQSFKDFNILVNGLIIDSEIPQHLRLKYYELCCSQMSYLHDQLIDGLNLKLVVGVIFETINIADAIRCTKLSTCCENLKLWDNTLKAFEDLGMKVGFLRAKIYKLLSLSSELEEAINCKRLEKLKAEEEFKALEMKLISVKEAIGNLDFEIEAIKMKGGRFEAAFMEEAKAPW